MSIRREQIFDAVETRFKSILKTGGYNTDLGTKVLKWRSFPSVREDEVPALVIRDTNEEPELIGIGKQQSEKRTLTIEYNIIQNGVDTDSLFESLRKGNADIENAIRTDVKWSGYALYTKPKGNSMGLPENNTSELIGVLSGSFEIIYQTEYFNPE